MLRRPPISTLFPYPTLFRSRSEFDRELRFRDSVPGNLGQNPVCNLARTLSLATRGLLVRRSRGKGRDRKSTRLNSSHSSISYAVFRLKKKKNTKENINQKTT